MSHLKPKPSPPSATATRHLGPRRGFLRERRGVGKLLGDRRVALLHEIDGGEVLPTAEAVGHPFACASRIVEVEHRRHGIDAQSVAVVALEPADRAGHEERTNLRTSVVEDRRLPVGVISLARDRRARRGTCRRSGTGHARPWGSATAPNRATHPRHARAAGRSSASSRPDRPYRAVGAKYPVTW